MKFPLLFIVLFSLFLSACKPNLLSITDNEDKGIKEVIGFYGGQCEYGVEKKVSTDKGSETKFWLKFSKSAFIDSIEKMAELPCSNIAYLFYKNLGKEKSNYTGIQSEIIFGDGESLKLDYTISQLEKVKSKIKLVDKIVALIKNKDFKSIKNYLAPDTTMFKYDREMLLVNLQKAEPDFGNAKEFIPYGFKFSKTSDGKEVLHISGAIKRDKLSNYFSVNLDPDTLQDEIYTLDYQL